MHPAIYPGTFDPITNGHLDIIKKGANLFNPLIVAVAKSSVKNPMFSLPERLEMLQLATKSLDNVQCLAFEGLLCDLAKSYSCKWIIRGLRAVSDFEFEFQMGYANKSLNPELETLFFMPALQNAFISSSVVRSILSHKGQIAHLVPPLVLDFINQRF
ncbi:pantetheine-phosphate adenylyltransferase [Helicobacter sp. NHP22-001]|uniref:pantetheine-phosphate adenylyltransferase n=1 Tax=Helicobacter sp. NHP22-001 TaxID=3040202 RepID=UPI00244D81D8|nr:pantetheine-phosphate adenylyltransferase [Helicobacter sp. NHP22-001]GMB95790.1 Phosphopantetheine adenylyltransferase CoaD [Helicobacter sp. NHP22-001]